MTAIAPDDEFVCFLDSASASRFSLERSNLRTVIVDMSQAPSKAASHHGRRSLRDVLAMTRSVARQPLDAFFFPSVYTWFPLVPSLPAVVTLHDAIPERFPGLTLPSRRARLFWWVKVRLALRQSRGVLTVSEFAARDIARIFGLRRDLIAIALEAPASAFSPSDSQNDVDHAARKYGLPEHARWFEYVGGFNPHKNVPDLVRSHAELVREHGDNPPYLLLVGTLDRDVFHGDRAAIEQAIRESGTEELVRWTGFVPDEDLRHLSTGAIALVLPSDCEGFGLPAIEAAACGTAVIATTESPLPELLRGGGLFVEPGDRHALTSAMRLLMLDPERRAAMGDVARRRAMELDWATGARSALSAIHRAAA